MILGKLNTKDRLARLNIISNGDILYVLCNEQEESIEHLFFSCRHAWNLWCSCMNRWNMKWVLPSNSRIAFDSWLAVSLGRMQKKQWDVCFFTVIWTIREARNRKIFANENFNPATCMEVMWHRWRHWSNSRC